MPRACDRKRLLRAGLLLAAPLFATTFWPGGVVAQRYNDEELRRLIVQESIARYGRDCPCPYSYAWNGRQCANDSAYMKRQADAPYCYPQDVPGIEIYRWRRERGS